MLMRLKSQHSEAKGKLSQEKEEMTKLQDAKKGLDEKAANLKIQTNYLKAQLKVKDAELAKLNIQVDELESFKYEKEKYEKETSNTLKLLNTLKDDYERKLRRIKELEKVNQELKAKVDEQGHKLMIKQQSSSAILNLTHKEKDKKIKQLEFEVSSLRDELSRKNTQNVITEVEPQATLGNANEEDYKYENDTLKEENNKLKETVKQYEQYILDIRGMIFCNT
jgi:hypothetical protein